MFSKFVCSGNTVSFFLLIYGSLVCSYTPPKEFHFPGSSGIFLDACVSFIFYLNELHPCILSALSVGLPIVGKFLQVGWERLSVAFCDSNNAVTLYNRMKCNIFDICPCSVTDHEIINRACHRRSNFNEQITPQFVILLFTNGQTDL